MSNFWRSPFITLCFVTLVALLPIFSHPVNAATFTVNLTSDAGDENPGDGACDADSESTGRQCTLRAALQEANASDGADIINFAISGTGVQTIAPETALPTVTEAVTIDGYTQSGSRANTLNDGTDAVLLIELNGAAAPSTADGLHFSASNCTVRGLVINGFGGNGIFDQGNNFAVAGCFIGTNAAGTAKASNGGNGILIGGVYGASIGGSAADRNLISANGANGISVQDAISSTINSNLIGTNARVTTDSSLGNGGRGITTSDGGTFLMTGNVISYNGGGGISIAGDDNRTGSNSIYSNGGNGIEVRGGSDNALRENNIYNNSGLGISLGGSSNVTPNDVHHFPSDPATDSDSGPNNLQNFPDLVAANDIDNSTVRVFSSLFSTPNTTFEVDFYESTTADPSGYGEGEKYIASKSVTTNGEGASSFSVDLSNFPPGHFITATATEVADGIVRSTSEFCPALRVTPSLSINDVTITEGNSGTTTANFTVTLSVQSTDTVTVNYATADGTAKEPADYTARNGTLTFAPGQTTKTIPVTVKGDVIDENNEDFFVNLSNPSSNVTVVDLQGKSTITDDDTSNISINDVSVREGNSGTTNAVFTVTLSTPSSRAIALSYGTQEGSASPPDDYTTRNGTLTVPAGRTTGTITVPIVGDTLYEFNETFTVRLSSPNSGTITDGTGRCTIVNDDAAPSFSINNVSVTEGNSGTTNAVFTVTLSSAAGFQVGVDYGTQAGSALAPGDYTGTFGTLTFNAGQTTKTISVPVVGDVTDESDENFFVALGDSNIGPANKRGQCTIIDDDTSNISINDVSVTEGNSGTTSAVFTVTLSTPSARAITLSYATQDGTAKASADYTARNGTLTIPAGETTGTIAVPVVGDTLDESNETFTVRLSSLSSGAISDGSGTGTIRDDDASPTLSINDVTVTEGNSGTINAVFTVTLSAVSGRPVTVSYATANGSAVSPSDYTARSGRLTIPAGARTGTITVSVKGDVVDENDEDFFVNLSTPASATLNDAQGKGTIKDDDSVSLSINDVTVTEGNSGTTNAVFTVTLSTPSAQSVGVSYTTQDGSAKAPSDYTTSNGKLTIPAGRTTGTITVPIVGDTLDESTETFTVRLSSSSSGTITDGSGTGTIQDDDAPPSLSVNDVTVTEGNSGTTNAVFIVKLSAPSAKTVTVAYATADGSAVAPGDYASRTGALTFAAGQTTQTITVSVKGDVIDENNETFLVNLSAPTNATLQDAQGQGTIRDDDSVSLSINDVTVNEGSSGTTNATFTVTLSAPPASAVKVNYGTQDGSAKAPADYTAQSGTLTIAAGATTGTITVPVVGDTLDEPNETFTVRLSNPINATISDAVGNCTIRDDDVLALNLTITPNVVAEGASATATITRRGSSNATALTVTLSSDSSRITLPVRVVIPASAASTTFNVNAVDNQIADGDLRATVTASATGFISSSAEVQVRDNETAKLTLRVSPNAFAENAGKGAATGTVTRDTPSGTALTVNLTSSNTGAAIVPATVRIAAGATIATFPIDAVDDAVVDGEQSSVITASATGLLSATATVRVADDDDTGRPRNDNFNRAQSLGGVQGTVTGRTLNATHEAGEPNHADGDGSHSVWYVWTAPAAGPVTFDTEGSAFDTVLAVYTGTAIDALTLIKDDDDGGSGATSRVSFGAVAGQRYYIAVDGFRDEQGILILRWNLTTSRPVNDDIARAQVIVGNAGQVSGDNRGATKESGEPDHANEDGGASVWYQWTCPTSGTATFDTRGSVFDTLMAVYAAKTSPPQTSALTPVASNDDTSITTIADDDDEDDDLDSDDNDDLTSRLSFEAVAGRTYFIAVDGFQGDQGPLILHWNLTVSSGSPISWYKKDANGQGQSGNWNNPDNWLPHRVPESGDLVSIKLPGTYTVALDIDANVSGIELGGSSGAATLAIANKRLVLRGRSTVARTGIVQLSGGTLSLASDGIVYGAIDWSGGQLGGIGTLHTLQGAQLRISGDASKVLAINALVNDGGATREGGGSLVLTSNARFVNNGQFTSRVAGLVRNQGDGESPIFFNYGTYTSTATGTSQFIGVEFWNAGRGNIQAGIFRLRGGGASYGVFDIASGARLEFSSEFFFAKDASSVIGGGQAEQLGGTFVVNTDDGEPVDVRDFELSDGDLNGANSQSRLEVNEFQWTGGRISGKGQITLKNNFRISGNGPRPLMGQTVNSRGNADWNGSGELTVGDGADINIQGNLYARDGFTVNASSGETPTLNNSGAIKPGDAAPDANVKTNALTPTATGVLNIFCSYHQAASGILNLDVRGKNAGSDYDQVNVRGKLTIDPGAKIEVNLPAGVTPQVGDRYRIVTFTERTGEFQLDFSKVVGLPANSSLLPVYSANALDLVVVSSVATEAPFISGRVTDGNGNGLANATVKRVSANNEVVSVKTDSNGYYAFNRVPPGNYFVSPAVSGWVFGIASVTVSTTQNAPETNFAGTPLNFGSSSKTSGAGKIPSAPSS